jgi:membrane-bound lytic murein transglycosylase MltF
MAKPNRYSPVVLSLALLFGCSGGSAEVYVPGDGYKESIEVTTDQGPHAVVEVDEPVVLNVTRKSGPWVEADAAALEDEACRLVRPPEPTELEVADNVNWVADPAEGATFNLGLSDDHTRTVSFDRPGVFTLTASSSSWCFEPFEGEPVTVEVDGPDEILDHVEEAWTGDLDGITERGFLRLLTVHNPLYFTFDGNKQLGLAVEIARLFEDHLAAEIGRVRSPTVVLIPVARDELLPGLVAGRGDIAVANLTITPDRQAMAAFSEPTYPNISELVVTGPAAPELSSLDDLAGTELHLRPSSSYFEHMEALNAERVHEGKAPIPVQPADENLEDHDLLDLVNAGVLPAIVVDSHKASFWAQVFPHVVVHEDLAIHTGANVGWAVRKTNPQLLSTVNTFAKTIRKGTLLGNMALSRYLGSTDWMDASVSGEHRERYEQIAQTFRRYAEQYDFDWLLIAAQGYQESRFDQSKRSTAGAVGIMQLLPSTAADKAVGIPDVSTVENNVHAGVKYLAWLRDRYFSEDDMDPLDRVLFSFAAYNACPGNVARARKKTKALGFDPNRWFGHVEVGMYRAVSGEPVSYVRNIYKYYVTYKRLEEIGRARERVLRQQPAG